VSQVHAAHHATAAAQIAVRALAASADEDEGAASQLASELEDTLHAAASQLVEADRCMARVVLSVQLWAGMVETGAAAVLMSRERSVLLALLHPQAAAEPCA
jgi:Spy/CpxP family protein refolding chaperone